MTAKCFVHLSDIHFGQEKGGQVVYHNDVKEQVLLHARRIAQERSEHGQSPVSGVLITGDIAYSGKAGEYVAASEWLRRLASAVRCAETDIQVVPGNHDIDRDRISLSAQLLLEKVMAGGQADLDACLATETDREVLYERFTDYRPFAYGYGCVLDQEGGRAGEKRFELAAGRVICFSGLNSALLCKRRDVPGDLMLGARQHVIGEEDGVAHIVLSHHPLHWFSDEANARQYLTNRASVLISGHEHQAAWKVDDIDGEPRFLSLAAGALVPPHATDEYNYSYNFIEFDLAKDSQGLEISVHPYCWDRQRVSFAQDLKLFEGTHATRTFNVRCRAFGKGDAKQRAESIPARDVHSTPAVTTNQKVTPMADDRYPALRLLFFQRLDAMQRLRVLDVLKLVPDRAPAVPNLAVERMLLERVKDDTAQLDRLEVAIHEQLTPPRNG